MNISVLENNLLLSRLLVLGPEFMKNKSNRPLKLYFKISVLGNNLLLSRLLVLEFSPLLVQMTIGNLSSAFPSCVDNS
jgi:hypothetical protein